MSHLQQQEENSTVEKFLDFLAQDMSKNPQNIKPINSDFLNRVKSLVAHVEFDINAPLSEEDE